jgi:hypothetical protein
MTLSIHKEKCCSRERVKFVMTKVKIPCHTFYDITEAFVQVVDVSCSICRISWEMEAKPW